MQIQQEIRKGTLIVFVTKYSGVLLGIIINSTLARLLAPSEFGTLAVVTVFITFFNILSDIGLGSGIVQNQHLGPVDISNIFKTSGMLSVLLAICFALCSYLVAHYYANPEYIRICQLLAIHLLFSALAVVPRNLLVKEKAFKLLGTIDISAAFATGLIAIALASQHYSYYSMIWRSIIQSVAVFGLYFYYSKIQIFRGFSLSGVRKIAGYSSYQFAFNFINYFSRNLDNILIGKHMGSTSLGVYNQAYQLMLYPIAYLTNVVTPVLHPVLARFQDNKPVIFQEYLKVIAILAKLGTAISIFVFFTSEEIILVMLGKQWLEVIPIFKILSLSIWVQMVSSSSGSIFQAAGRTDLLFTSGLLSAVVVVSAIIVGVLYYRSLEITAWLLSASFFINFIQAFGILVIVVLKSSVKPVLLIFWKLLPQIIVLFTLLYAASYYFREVNDLPVPVSFLFKLAILAVTLIAFNYSLFQTSIKRFLPNW